MKSVITALAVVLFTATQAYAWEMVANDSAHSSSIPLGASAPLKRSWRITNEGGSTAIWPVVDAGTVYASLGPGVVAVGNDSGDQIWFRTFDEGQGHVTPALDRTALYLPLRSGHLVALDRKDGAERWRFLGAEFDTPPVLAGRRIFLGSPKARTFFSVTTAGELAWKVRTELRPDSVPAVSQGTVVFSTQDPDSPRALVVALDADDGREIWHFEHTLGNSSPSILGDKVVFGGGDFNAYALDLKTGKVIWKTDVGGRFGIRSMPALAFGDVFLADRTGGLMRLDGDTGRIIWRTPQDATEGTMDQSFPVIAGKTLFIGTGAGFLYAFDTEDGRILWKDEIDGNVLSGAADAERFYFGVKFGDEGLYAYEHDPQGKTLPPASPPRGRPRQLVSAALILALLIGLPLFVYGRIRRRRATGS